MQRIVVIGSSCSGKSTLAERLSVLLNTKHVELDALYWQSNWKARTNGEFRALVKKATADESWVVDGNYAVAQDIIWPNATTIIWLNYSFPVVLYRSIYRSIVRVATKKTLFAGNVETFRHAFVSRESIIWWVTTTFHRKRAAYSVLLQSELAKHAEVIVLNNRQQTNEFVRQLEKSA